MPANPYTIQLETEATIFGSGFALLGLSHIAIHNKKTPTLGEIESLNPKSLFKIDRPFAGNYDTVSAKHSYYFLYSSLLISPISGFLWLSPKNKLPILIMSLEVAQWSAVGSQAAKASVRRFRPRAYPTSTLGAPSRLAKDQTNSFFSGHASAISSSLFYTATIIAQKSSSTHAAIAYASASVLSIYGSWLRVKAGGHFPTDVLTGLIWGGAVGHIIPRQHLTGSFDISLFSKQHYCGVVFRKKL